MQKLLATGSTFRSGGRSSKGSEKDCWGRISVACVFGFTCHVSTPSLSGQCTPEFHPFSKRQITTASVQRFPVTHCLSPVRASGFCKSLLLPTTSLFPRIQNPSSLPPSFLSLSPFSSPLLSFHDPGSPLLSRARTDRISRFRVVR